MSASTSPISPATASSSKGKSPLKDTDSKTTPPRYSTILPKLPLPINPTLPTPFLPPPPPPKDLPLPPAQSEFIAYPTFTERKMHISSPAFILLLVLLFLESTVIFIYTTIGLVKNNPLPYLYAPVQSQYPLCQDNVRVNSGLRYGLNIPGAVAVGGEQQISYATSISTVYSTLITTIMHPATFTPPVMPNLQLLQPIVTTATTSTPIQSTNSPSPPSPTPDTNAFVTSVVYSTTTPLNSAETAKSTIYITTIVAATNPAQSPPSPTTDTNSFVTSIVYSTTTQSAPTEPAHSTTYITAIVATTNTNPVTSSLSNMGTTDSSIQADVNTFAIPSTSTHTPSSVIESQAPTTTTVDAGAVVTSVVFSTTVVGASGVEAPRSTVYVTTVVPGR